ncbi:MAG: STAS domain-containing protein [Ignavibacteria bacterium]|nr:STAS domain-containing protein [Ignavibacteria bacterium]
MAVKVTTMNNLEIAILEPRGSLIGGEETDELKDKARDLLEQGNRKLVLDLGGVAYINSSGIGALVGVHAMYTKAGGKIKLCQMGKGVQNVFVITRLASVFDVEETRDGAVKSF